jgi:arylsulfatase A-like enzyme
VLTNDPPDGGYERFDDSSTLATWLHDAGYNTAMIGKYLNGYGQALRDGNETIPPGWDEWFAFEVGYERFLLNDNGSIAQFSDSYSTDVLRDHAVTFVEDALSGGPFFLYFNTFAPHFRARPAARHEGTCEGIPVLRPPSFNEQDISDKPGWMQQLPFASDVEIRASDVFRSDQICTLKAVDEAVAAILDALGSELDNTLVIFTSDNGLMLLEHRLQFKNCIYEECIRVPLAVRYPPLGHGTSEELALNIDLAPTILEAAGLSIPESVDGQSLFALDRDDFLIEVFGPTRPPAIAVRTTRYKYAELATGDVELYDLQSDRYELTNLANDPASAALRTDLAARLAELELP